MSTVPNPVLTTGDVIGKGISSENGVVRSLGSKEVGVTNPMFDNVDPPVGVASRDLKNAVGTDDYNEEDGIRIHVPHIAQGKQEANGHVDYVNPAFHVDDTEPDGENELEPESGEKKKKKAKRKASYVSFLSLFRYADSFDIFLMIMGTIFGVANGGFIPGQFAVLGELMSKFIAFGIQLKRNDTMPAKHEINIENEILFYAKLYAAIGAGSFFAAYIQCSCWAWTATRQANRIRSRFMENVMRQDIGWFDMNESGGLTARLTDDVTQIQTGIGDKIGELVHSYTILLGGLFLGFFYAWKLTLVILACCPALIVTGAMMGRVLATFTAKQQDAYASAGSVAEEVISSIRTVAAFGGERKEVERFKERLVDAERAGMKKNITTGIAMGAFSLSFASLQALGFWYGSKLIADPTEGMKGGDLLVVFFCIVIGAAQVGQSGPNLEAIAAARGAAYVVYEIIDRKSPIDPLSDQGLKLKDLSGDIEFQHVEFSYPSRPDIKILKGFNLKIEKGSTVALVGESGCGKSTVNKLVQRFYDADEGVVLFDGVDIKSLNVEWLRQYIGVVSQEPVLFDATIAENIRFGKSDATLTDIEMAAMDANAYDFIKALPKGFDTPVGEGGAQLSGGQKQRIAIARALVGNPRILLLDEATSALDTESESVVQTALDNASVGRTTIIIAHRLSTVRNADVIVAVKGGKVEEMGTHAELMAKRGVYFQLVMLQSIAEEEIMGLSEHGSVLSEVEMNALLEIALIRRQSQLGDSNEDLKIVQTLQREISERQSVRQKKKSKMASKKRSKKSKKDELEEEQVAPAPLSRILRVNKPEWPYMCFGFLFSGLVGINPVVFALLLGTIIRSYALPGAELVSESRKYSLLFLALGASTFVGHAFSNYLFGKAGEKLTRRLREMAFSAILRQDISYFDDPFHGTGHLTARLARDASSVRGATSSRLNVMVQVSVTFVGALVMAFYYSWKLTLLILGFVPLLVIGGMIRGQRFKNFASTEGKRRIEASALATQGIMNIRTVASLGKERYFAEKFKEMLHKPYRQAKKQAQIYGIAYGLSRCITLFANSAAFALGGKLVQNREMTYDQVFKMIIVVTYGSQMAGQALSFAPDYLSAKIAAARIFKLFDRVPQIDAYSDDGLKPDQVVGGIEFVDVKFNYPFRPDVPILQGLSLSIAPGQKVALVGASGCGKSTSVSLLERFYNPAEGSVFVDGKLISEYNVKWLRSQISIVSQEPVLFACSIRDNILYGVDNKSGKYTQAHVEEAAKAANAHNFICGLPKGYDTLVGEKGSQISGGQKQRIAIARALIRNPRVLLLDEATSALDTESEKVVQEALDRAMVGRTSIIIAHRLTTVQNADVIVVIQGGRVIEMGSHHDLMQMKGAYYMLNVAQ